MMQSAGKVVEKVSHLKEAKKTVSPVGNNSPLEKNQQLLAFPPENLIRKWAEILELKEFPHFIPNLSGKKVLQATTNANRLWDLLNQKGPESILDFDLGYFEGNLQGQKPPHLQMVKGNFLSAPFTDQAFDYLFLLGAGIRREDPTLWMKEISRILKDNSRLVLCLLHPFLEYRFHPSVGFTHRIDQYFMALKKAEIYVEEMKECLADETLKSSLGLAKNDKNFAQIKDFPLLLIFRGIRLKRRNT